MLLNLDTAQQNLLKDSLIRPSQVSLPRRQFPQDALLGPLKVAIPNSQLTKEQLFSAPAELGI